MKKFVDKENKFFELFDPENGAYFRSGVIDTENKRETEVDPFMRCFPSLIDVGIMQTCVCSHLCNVDCYQKAGSRTGDNMNLADFGAIIEQCKGKVFQFALGGAGDVDTHENFLQILKMCRDAEIVPNFTTSGIAMTKEKAAICKKYCGAVAVSEHHAAYTEKALHLLLDAGVKTNIHYVLDNKSIDDAIAKLETDSFMDGINAVVFLLYKPIGLGRKEKILTVDNPKVQRFFELVDTGNFHHKIGFDSCTAPGIVNFCHNINMDSMDFCEGGRYSMYIDANMNAMPCSFGNQDEKYYVSLRNHTIQEAWDGEVFTEFRRSLKDSCPSCKDRAMCAGGCPICRDVVLCNRKALCNGGTKFLV